MRSIITLAAALAFLAGPALAGNKNTNKEADDAADISDEAPAPNDPAASGAASGQTDFCFYETVPTGAAEYKIVRRLKVAKGTYGGATDLLPRLADATRRRGGDAIIDYSGGQHFGFWPWRMVRPIVQGTAIKWGAAGAPDCKASGGTPMSAILAKNQGPANDAPAKN